MEHEQMAESTNCDTDPCQTRAFYKFFIGHRRATIVSDGPLAPIPPIDEFPSVPEEDMSAVLRRHSLGTDALCFQQNCLVLEVNNQRVLFDTGMGASTFFGESCGRLIDNLELAGISPDEIDVVLLTHAHPDHCFGLVDSSNQPRFKNADVYVSKRDYAFWTSEETATSGEFARFNVSGARAAFEAYGNRVRLIEPEAQPVLGVKAIDSPGHTVGHLCYLIESAGERALFIGDVAYHHAVSFVHPDWHSSFDTNPEDAVLTRTKLLQWAATEKIRLVGYHYPFPGLGYAIQEGKGFRFAQEPMQVSLTIESEI
jgi:glyoxylase-like metal-dependent hydrolase (beta-lactamase superfamily II)